MKAAYPFHPLQDSLLGKILQEVLKEGGRDALFLSAIESHLEEGKSYTFTPRAQKQIQMNLLPTKIRGLIDEDNLVDMEPIFLDLIRGIDSSAPCLDIAMELMEWIVTGYDKDPISLHLLNLLCNSKIQIGEADLQKLKILYNQYLKEEEDEFRKREDSHSESADGND
jgi:hypothetical protein